ncbi:MFS transporter [Peribacillus sp. NPDC097675]|uniref:MFS transporter n=1 Tax=Peribacillus sp. NPDC097675 TaxID=3390618 RepID=UPI003CFCE9E5
MLKQNNTISLLAILTGAFLVPLNSTMITIGLSTIMDYFQTNVANVSWIVTVYLIIMVVAQPIAGKLGDMYGTRKLFLLGLLLFLGASLVCVFAPNLPVLIIGRAIQALGGAFITPNGTAIIRFITPKSKLTKAFGVFGFAMSIGAALGPLLGAFLIGTWGWQSTFWINIPFTVLSFLIAYKFLPNIEPKSHTRLDIQGSFLLGTFLTVLVLIVTNEWYTNGWLWLVFLFSFVLFIYREKRCGHPIIDFSLFKDASFTSANLSILLNNAIMYCTILIMPMMFERDAGYSIGSIGLLLFIFSLAISIASWLGGYVEGKMGKGRTVRLSFGLLVLALGLYVIIPTIDALVFAGLILFLGGIGSGLGVPSMQAASLESVAKELTGVASGIYSMFRYFGSIAASVIISLQIHYSVTMYILIVFSVFGLIVSKGMFIHLKKEEKNANHIS